MAITRRQFLKRTGLATAGTLLGPGLFTNPFVQQALAFTNRYFIVLFLDGGNDGLNTVIPADNGANTESLRTWYQRHRNTGPGGIQIPATGPGGLAGSLIGTDALTGCQLALHPGFNDNPGLGLTGNGLKQIWDDGRLAVIQGCGYPEYSLSHDDSRSIWQTGNPLGYAPYSGTGWMGRYLVGTGMNNGDPPYGPLDIPGVNISDSVVGEFRTTGTSVLAIRRLAEFGFPYDYDYPGDASVKRTAFQSLYNSAGGSGNGTIQYLGNTGIATDLASQNYPQAHTLYVNDTSRGSGSFNFNDMYSNGLNTSTARGFREIAKMIYANERSPGLGVNARFFQLSNGGYDTHSNQGGSETNGQHYDLHSEVGNAIRLFWEDLKTMGTGDSDIRSKVCILVWSEFSRRIPQNDNGTDHGSQGPMFVLGGTVVGGVYGTHPNIYINSAGDMSALDNNENTPYWQGANLAGNTGNHRSTDFRDVYGTVLTHWLDMDPNVVKAQVLKLDTNTPVENYWTAENFNLGFLTGI
jgi:uncharacterized protein (DUF1501 family)